MFQLCLHMTEYVQDFTHGAHVHENIPTLIAASPTHTFTAWCKKNPVGH